MLPESITPEVTTGHVAHHLDLHEWFNNLSNIIIGPDGTEADIADALADLHAAGFGEVILMGSVYDVEGLADPAFEITIPTVSLRSAAGGTVFNYSGTGDCISVRMADPDADQSGCVEGIHVIGTHVVDGAQVVGNTNPDACGVHMGDVVGFTLRDVWSYGFKGTSGKALWLDNQAYWTEQCEFDQVWLADSTHCLLLDVNGGNQSFEYNRFALRMNVNADQTGFTSRSSAFIRGGDFNLKCNVTGNGRVGSVEGASLWVRVKADVKGEHNDAGVGTGIEVEAGSAFRVTGEVSLPSLACTNHNAPSVSPTYQVLGSGQGSVDGNSHDLGSGEKADLFGSGITARVIPVQVVDSDSPYAANGFLHGAGVACPYVCMFDAANNAFIVYALAFGDAPEAMREVFRIDAYNNVLLQECVAPPSTPATGAYLFVQGGVLKAKRATGAVTVLTP